MTEARWARITEVFRRAMELPSGQGRQAWLDETCGGDLTLRRNVQRMLDAHSEPSLESPAGLLQGGILELAPGEHLAQYRVEERIGEGGMGVVYRAFDTRLQRAAALKVLPLLFAESEDRRHRLMREARAASSLNHPNIVTVYEAGNDQDLDFIAMEYVDGRALDELIGENGMPAPTLVRYALQIGAALEAAHAARILHRDIKPSNLMVTRDDRVKVLDFGLARVMGPEQGGDGLAQQAAAQTVTGQQLIRGTPAYMSPEQAEGRKLDGRSDIFSFGCVLYQMATGRKAFDGDSNLAVMYAIVNETPRRPSEIAALPPDLESLILRCLEKDPGRRFGSVGELKAALESLDTGARPRRTNPAAARTARRVAAGGAAAVLLAAAAWTALRGTGAWLKPPAPQRTVKFAITPANLRRGGAGEIDSEVSISRDGKHIAYVESQGGQLWIRDIDSEQARPVPGATGVYQAFWSPGNQWIGYSSGQACGIRPGCDLVKIPVGGGTPRRIVRLAGSFKRAWWSSDGATIVYCDSLGLYTVPAEGGVAQRIVEHSHIEHPSVIDLSGGRRAFLYQALDAEQPGHAIYLQVAGESRRHLLKVSRSNNPYPAWSPTGHLIYVDGPNTRPEIWAMPLSLSDLKPAGNAFRIVERGASPMVSATGTLVYGDPPSNRSQMRWVDRSGRSLSTIGEGEAMSQVVLSRDGRSVAVAAADPEPDIFIYDAERGTRTRLTADPNAEAIGSWTPAGDEITYASFNTRESAILSRAPGAPVKEVLRGAPRVRRPEWSPDGRFLMYTTLDERNKGDLLYRERRAGGTLGDERVFLRTPAHEGEARFSPDGRRVAYVSDESGRPEVYITEFPEGRSRIRVSENGGGSPRWRRDGRELFYAEWGKLWAVSVAASAPIRAGRPAMLFEKRSVGLLQFDTAADGRRFVVLERPAGEPPLAVHVVQNWFEEFRTVR